MTGTTNVGQQHAGDADPPKRGSWLRRYFGDFRPLRVSGGIVLIVLVLAAAGCAVTFFAAAQFQSRIAELSLNGAPMTIWRVDAFRGEFDDWAKDIRRLRDGIAQDQVNLAKDKENNLVLAAKHATMSARLDDDVRSLKLRVIAASPQPATSPADQAAGPAPTISDTLTQIELLLSQDELQKRFGDDFAALKKRYVELADFGATIKTNEAKIKGFEAWIVSLQEQRKDRVEAAAKLFGETNTAAAPELVERIVNITAELNSLSKIWHGIVYRTALWTNDMLVLLLLISMGVLGSALNLLAVFIANDQEALSFGEYPLRLAFGAVLAIVMFIIAKAGVPILADTSKIGGNAPLNPYFISPLAIVSGLMSDRSMAAVRGVATSILQGVGGADYARRYSRVVLDDALKTANRDANGLARVLGIGVDETKKLFSGKDLIAPDRQKLIAAYLGQPPRELFSDVPAD